MDPVVQGTFQPDVTAGGREEDTVLVHVRVVGQIVLHEIQGTLKPLSYYSPNTHRVDLLGRVGLLRREGLTGTRIRLIPFVTTDVHKLSLSTKSTPVV